MQVSKSHAEPWNVVALYSELKGRKFTAINFVKKALSLNDQHAPSYVLRGNLFLGIGEAEKALEDFTRAHELAPEYGTFQGMETLLVVYVKEIIPFFSGLITANLKLERYNEALAMAMKCRELMPKNPKAITLLASVISHSSDSFAKVTHIGSES